MSSATCTRNDTIWKFVGVPSGAPPSPPLVYGYFRPLGQKQPEITSSPKSHHRQLGARHRHWASPITNRFLGATWPNAKRSLHAFLDFPTEVPTRSGPKAAIEWSRLQVVDRPAGQLSRSECLKLCQQPCAPLHNRISSQVACGFRRAPSRG